MNRDLKGVKVGDDILVMGQGYAGRPIQEWRTVARLTKTLIVDSNGTKWRRDGWPPGVEYPQVHVHSYRAKQPTEAA